jgi:hypothetical protein
LLQIGAINILFIKFKCMLLIIHMHQLWMILWWWWWCEPLTLHNNWLGILTTKLQYYFLFSSYEKHISLSKFTI